MRIGITAAVALSFAAVFASSASAEIVVTEVVKPQVVTPHQASAANQRSATPVLPSATPAGTPSPEASSAPQAAPETTAGAESGKPSATGGGAVLEGPAPGVPQAGNRVKSGGGWTGPSTGDAAFINYENALWLAWMVSGAFNPLSERTLLTLSLSQVRMTNIMMGGDGGQSPSSIPDADSPTAPDTTPAEGGPAGHRIDDDIAKSEE